VSVAELAEPHVAVGVEVSMFAIFALLSAPAEACFSLVQHRLLLLGQDRAGRVVALELSQVRDGDPEGGPVWSTSGRLVVLGSDTVLADWPTTQDANPMVATQRLHAAATAKTATLAGFTALEPTRTRHCSYSTTCGDLSLSSDSEAGRMSLLEGDRSDEIHFPISFLSQANLSGEWPIVTDEEALRTAAPRVWSGWSLGSVQHYQAGNSELLRVHITRGATPPFEETPEVLPDGLFKEPIRHHGKGFDILIVR
jgi:hypothetical protein